MYFMSYIDVVLAAPQLLTRKGVSKMKCKPKIFEVGSLEINPFIY